MTSNPMQRKARSSFLLGVLLAVVILGVIIVLLFFQLTKIQEEKQIYFIRPQIFFVLML